MTTARQRIENAQRIISEFAWECAEAQYTDTNALWDYVLPAVQAELRSAQALRLDDDEDDWTPGG